MNELLLVAPLVLAAYAWRIAHDWRSAVHRHGYAIGYHDGSDIRPYTTLRIHGQLMVIRSVTQSVRLNGPTSATIECEDPVSAMLADRI